MPPHIPPWPPPPRVPSSGHNGPAPTRAQGLLAQRLVLPLFDGFDELPPQLRPVALDAINQSLPPGHGLVLSSRTTEYHDALTPSDGVPVRLIGASGIELHPLDATESAAYLHHDAGGDDSVSAHRWRPVLTQLGADTYSPVRAALRTPLMLFLARTVYNPRPGERPAALPDPGELCDTTRFPDPEAIRVHLFDAYIPSSYRARPGHPLHWSHERAEQTMVFLAHHLEHTLRGSIDLAWWQLRSALPRRRTDLRRISQLSPPRPGRRLPLRHGVRTDSRLHVRHMAGPGHRPRHRVPSHEMG